MKKAIVKYHNDFNRLSINSLGVLEQNILFEILFRLKEQSQTIVKFTADDISAMVDKNLTRQELTNLTTSLFKNIFGIYYKIILPPNVTEYTMLFDKLRILHDKENNFFVEAEFCISRSFEYLLNNLFGNYTSFELIEFKTIQSKYAKTLYRLLKEVKFLGVLEIEWDEFLRLMSISKDTRVDYINRKIIKPSIKELSISGNLFQQSFKNLTFKKTYKRLKNIQGGRTIDKIIFTFAPEKMPEKSDNSILHNAKSKIQSRGKKVVMNIIEK